MLPDVGNTVFADIHGGIVDGTAKTPIQPVLTVGSIDGETELALMRRLWSLRVDGVVLDGYSGRRNASRARCRGRSRGGGSMLGSWTASSRTSDSA